MSDVAVIVSEPTLHGVPCMQLTEMRPSGDVWETCRTLTVKISGSRCLTWMRLRVAALEEWGVQIPDSSNPDPVVLS